MLRSIFIILSIFLGAFNAMGNSDKVLITINQFVSHPALDESKQGIEEALKKRGLLPDKVNIRLDNAQGNIAASVQIAKHQTSLSPKFMIAIATPSAQSNLKAVKDNSTLAFVAVTDPETAGLTSQKNIIGVSDQLPLFELLEVSLRLIPNIKTIGVIFNSGEVNSAQIIEKLEIVALEKNIRIEKASITSSTNIKVATQSLIGKVDIIYIPLDNSVVSGLANLIQVSSKANIPVIANDPSLIDKGILLALGSDYFKSGEQLGNMIADLIENKKLASNIQTSNVKELKINKGVAAKLNIIIPADFNY